MADNLAILIIAHANPGVFGRIVRAMQHPRIKLFAHIDLKSDIAPFEAAAQGCNIEYVRDRQSVSWGGYSQVAATISLLRAASALGDCFAYTLISGDSIPIISNESLLHIHEHCPTNIRAKEQFPGDKSYKRVANTYVPDTRIGRMRGLIAHDERYFDPGDFEIIRRAERVQHYKKNIPFRVFKGPQWISISGRHWAMMAEYIQKNPYFMDVFEFSAVPDEVFFPTLARLVDEKHKKAPGTMGVDWTRSPKPFVILSKTDIPRVFSSGRLFFRKFSDKGLDVVEAILNERLSPRTIMDQMLEKSSSPTVQSWVDNAPPIYRAAISRTYRGEQITDNKPTAVKATSSLDSDAEVAPKIQRVKRRRAT